MRKVECLNAADVLPADLLAQVRKHVPPGGAHVYFGNVGRSEKILRARDTAILADFLAGIRRDPETALTEVYRSLGRTWDLSTKTIAEIVRSNTTVEVDRALRVRESWRHQHCHSRCQRPDRATLLAAEWHGPEAA